ncbi:hypothetical protein HAX54_006005 [Datura stramonium]|uniref:Uncharacterized protein n=1 Tax=Datura stramonium TaxID=4076 RepID=A0ABS8RHV0_DATST|nr:hypothetical protein [Datura stramonium]
MGVNVSLPYNCMRQYRSKAVKRGKYFESPANKEEEAESPANKEEEEEAESPAEKEEETEAPAPSKDADSPPADVQSSSSAGKLKVSFGFFVVLGSMVAAY